jgi:hypothetical protein
MVDWGDVPTWVTAGVALAALIAASRAYRTQSEQLRLQRVQLEDQTRIQEREQANLIDVSARVIDGAQAQVLPKDESVPVHMVVVTNGSNRPVREVAVLVEAASDDMSVRHEKVLAEVSGTLETYALGSTAQAQAFVPVDRSGTMPVLRSGQSAGFVWSFSTAQYRRLIPWVRFTDDAGLHWEIDNSLHLEKLAERDW